MTFGFKRKPSSGHKISKQTVDDFLDKAKFVDNLSGNELKIKINENRIELENKLAEVDKLLDSFSDILPKGREMEYMLQINAAKDILKQEAVDLETLQEAVKFIDMVLEQIRGKI